MPNQAATIEENNRKEQQLSTAVGLLKGIDLKTVSPDGIATARSLVISLSHYVLSLAQSLPVEQRMAVEAQVKQVIEAAERAVAKMETALTEQQTREAGIAKQIQIDNVLTTTTIADAPKTAAEVKEQLTERMPVQAAQEFTALRGVLDNPVIAREFVPLEVMANLVSSVLPPVETAEFLVRETVVNGTHQILTNYVGNEEVMPDLTRSMIDNFRDVGQNQRLVAQCAEVQQGLEQQRQAILAQGANALPVDAERVEVLNRAIQEVKNTKVVANTAIGKEEVGETLKDFGSKAHQLFAIKKEILEPVMLVEKVFIKIEEGREVPVVMVPHEEDDTARMILAMIKNIKRDRGSVKDLFDIKNEPSPLENIAEMLLKKPLPSIELDQNPLELNKSWAERALKKNVTPEKDQGQIPGR